MDLVFCFFDGRWHINYNFQKENNMNKSLRFLIVLVPIIIFTFFANVLLVEDDEIFSKFNTKNFPSFELNDLNGIPVKYEYLDGIKLVNIWASWCITCLVEHPFLTKLSDANIQIVGLNYKDSNNKASAWLQKHGNPYILSIYDPRGDLAFDLGVTGAPESYLVIDNQVVAHIQGEMTPKKWETIFHPLIKKASNET